MADEQDRWLDRGAAERLLRGEPLEAVETAGAAGAGDREAAGRLAEALASLRPREPRSDAELPGEQAALAAFRAARTAAGGAVSGAAGGARTDGSSSTGGVGLVDREESGPAPRRARWGRPLRLGVAAGLAAGMLGGAAVAVGTGALPTPFRDGRPAPAASVTAAEAPRRPLASPSPEDAEEVPDGGSAPGPGSGSAGGRSGEATPDDPPGSTAPDRLDAEDSGERGRSREWWSAVLAACRDIDRGEALDAHRRRDLEDAAGGTGRSRVEQYCDRVLNGSNGFDAPQTSDDASQENGVRSGQDEGHQGGWGDKGVRGDRGGKDKGHRGGEGGGDGDRGGRTDGDGRGGHGAPGGGGDRHGDADASAALAAPGTAVSPAPPH